MEQKFDIVVVGAGLIGSSIAYHLTQHKSKKNLRIALLDLDFQGTYSASELNAGGARMEWCHDINIELSKSTIEFLTSNFSQFGFRQKGYLWLYDEKGWQTYQNHVADFKCQHLEIEELSPKEVSKRFPFIDQIEDIQGATFSPKDGIFNPNLLKQFYRDHAKFAGVVFIDGACVKEIIKNNDRSLDIVYDQIAKEDVLSILSGKGILKECPKAKIRTQLMVNAAGSWAVKLAKLYGHAVDCKPVRRQISIFDCHELNLSSYGMIVDTSGVYFHAEADHILAGYATPGEPSGYNFKYDGDVFFETEIWPRLVHRMSKAQALKHRTGWAGLYSVTPDLSGIMGCIDTAYSIYEAHSFTGRGAMQSYGVGLSLAELILEGQYHTIDATSLHPNRFQDKEKFLYEGLHI